MVISLLANVAKEKVENNKFLGDIPHANVYNQGLSTSNLDIDSCRYAPQAIMQADVETFGNQNSPLVNQDIVIRGSFDGVEFQQYTENNLALDSGIVTINPVVSSKTSNALLYQGYAVLDGDL